MATSSLRLSRLSDRKITIQRQLIAFSISQTGFLLPITSVYRAIIFAKQDFEQGWVKVDQHQLPVMDIKGVIFGETAGEQSQQRAESAPLDTAAATLILQQSNAHPAATILIDSAPALCRLAEDRFVPLPHTYRMNCVDEMTDRSGDYPLHFLLNPEQLLSQLKNYSSFAQTEQNALSSIAGFKD